MAKNPLPVGAPQPWPPPPPPPATSSSLSPLQSSNGDNKSYRDCIQGICSASCPQLCSNLPFPPPRPFFIDSSHGGDDDSSGRITPLMAALIAVLAAAFLLLFYYTVVSRYCRRRRRRRRLQISADDRSSDVRIDPMIQDPTRPAGLDESFIRQITVFKYRRSDGLIEGTDCAVCLSEFKEEENLRLMPNCEHAFHIPCIDTWLRTHSNCPLCRATMNPVPPARPGSNPGDPTRNGGVSVAAMQIQSRDDAVLVIREEEGEVIVCHEVLEEAVEGRGEGEERENGEQVQKGDP